MNTDSIPQPAVSVIITTFNRRKELGRAIRSVLAQSFPDFELIVVDDCSAYDVADTVKTFNDPRIKFLKTDTNTGHDGVPKNLALKAARGEYVAFLDDDDEYRTDALKIMLTYARESGADVAYGDYLNHHPNGKVSPGWSLDFRTAALQRFNFISMCCVIAKRSAVMAVGGFDESVPKFKDWNLWIRLQKNRATFIHFPIIVTEVHQLESSVSNKFKNETGDDGQHLPTFFDPVDCPIWATKTILGDERPLRVAVYTLTMDRLEYTKRMADAMDRLAGYEFDWFVIDQGSKDGTQEWLKRCIQDYGSKWRRKLHYRLNEQNVGLGKGWNDIVDWVRAGTGQADDNCSYQYDVIIKVDNDAEMLTDGWLEAMVHLFRRNRNICLSPYVEGLDGSPGGVLRQRASGEQPYLTINDRVVGIVPHLGGIVYATPPEIFDGFRFDEESKGNKDVLLSQHAAVNGYTLFYLEEFRVWHIDGSKGQEAKFPEYFKGK